MEEEINPISIVMTTWNRPEMTERVIKALAKNTVTPSRLIVVDNGSDEKTRKMLRDMMLNGLVSDFIPLAENRGLEYAKDLGMNYVHSDLFISTDNDCLPMYPDSDGDWLSKLVQLMADNPDYGAISSRTQVMIGTGNIFEDHEGDGLVEFPHPGGSLRIMRTDLVKEIGGWRDDVPSRGQEERYICGKIRELGYKTGFATDIKCWHCFGKDKNWGYGSVKPKDHGHNPVNHPSIQNGDNEEEIEKWLKGN